MKTLSAVLCLVAFSSLAQSLDAGTGLKLETLSFTMPAGEGGLSAPLDLRFLPDGRMVVIEKGGFGGTGNARVLLRATNGMVTVAGRFSVRTDSEEGLLGVEVDPDFVTTRRLFFYYSRSDADGGSTGNRGRIVSIQLSAATDKLDLATEKELVKGIRESGLNHNGGSLVIANDKKLYAAIGDTGCNANCCPANNTFASCLTNPNGKILRIELDGGIPLDNPLVANPVRTACAASGCTGGISPNTTGMARTDIYAWGLRNPFRIWADPVTGNVIAGDVGEGAREEVDVIKKGKHFGYPWKEGINNCANGSSNGGGSICFADAGICEYYTPGSGNCEAPIWDCSHGDQTNGQNNCISITGGAIVDSCDWPAQWRGTYIFGDNNTGFLSSLKLNATRDGTSGANPRTVFGRIIQGNTAGGPTTFRPGPDGALYITDTTLGKVFRISPITPLTCDAGMGTGGGAGGGTGGGSAGGGTGGGSVADGGTDGGSTGGGSGGGAAGGGTGGGATGGGAGGAAGGGTGGAAGGGSGGAAGGGAGGGSGGAAGGGSAGGGSGTGGVSTGGGSGTGGAAGGGSAGGATGTGGGTTAPGGCGCTTTPDVLGLLAPLMLAFVARRRRA